jgi:hypothetical protein
MLIVVGIGHISKLFKPVGQQNSRPKLFGCQSKLLISAIALKENQVEDCKKIILFDWRAFLFTI